MVRVKAGTHDKIYIIRLVLEPIWLGLRPVHTIRFIS
jgi:hypothetical protein